jgi:hypothetical protein
MTGWVFVPKQSLSNLGKKPLGHSRTEQQWKPMQFIDAVFVYVAFVRPQLRAIVRQMNSAWQTPNMALMISNGCRSDADRHLGT